MRPELLGVKRDGAVIRCPGCKGSGNIDRDQYEGTVSILCEFCGYHETHDLRG